MLIKRVTVNHPDVIREGDVTSQVWQVNPESPVRNRGETAVDTSNAGSRFSKEMGPEMGTTVT